MGGLPGPLEGWYACSNGRKGPLRMRCKSLVTPVVGVPVSATPFGTPSSTPRAGVPIDTLDEPLALPP